jgi:hypothetical protein
MKRYTLIIVVIGMLVSLACGSSSVVSTEKPDATPEATIIEEKPEATKEPSATEKPAPTEKPEPTDTPSPTDTPEPTVPVYTEPIVLAELDGVGNQVTDNYEFPPCGKAVFYWEVEPGSYGAASIIIHLHNVEADDGVSIVNEFSSDIIGVLSGSALQPLIGGEYFFSTENTDEPWRIRVECQDGDKPVAEGMDVTGIGDTVTENFTLSTCRKSIFHWSVEPGSYGSAALIVHLCSPDGIIKRGCPPSIVNEFETDLTAPLEGEALERVDDGDYFLVISNTNAEWHVWWECQD